MWDMSFICFWKRTSDCSCIYLSTSSLCLLPVLGCVDLALYGQSACVCKYLWVGVCVLRIVSMDKILCFVNTSIIFISDLKWHTSVTRCPYQLWSRRWGTKLWRGENAPRYYRKPNWGKRSPLNSSVFITRLVFKPIFARVIISVQEMPWKKKKNRANQWLKSSKFVCKPWPPPPPQRLFPATCAVFCFVAYVWNETK